MVTRVALVALFLISMAMAGCAGDDADSEPTEPEPITSGEETTTTTTSTTSQSSEPDEGDERVNQSPGLTLVASVLRGEAPLSVDFNLSATDPDGDTLFWTLDADGDGTADFEGMEANFTLNATFDYAEPGVFTANFTVSDGEFDLAKTLEVNVTSAPVEVEADVPHWYFSADPDAATCIEDFLIQDLGSAASDSSFCLAQAVGPAVGLVEVATAQMPSIAHAAGTSVEGQVHFSHAFVHGNNPNVLVGDLEIGLQTAAGSFLGGATVSVIHDDPTGYAQVDFAFSLANDVADGDVLVLTLDWVGPAAGILWGGGESEPTGFAIGGPYVPAL
ncbi:MAG: PKD domain-containing protein [Thermoplasmatota archaeon]